MSTASSALTRRRSGRLYIVIGAVLAVLAFGTAAALASLPFIQGSTVGTKVVVASHDIKARTQIQASDLQLASYQPAPPLAFTALKDVVGKSARVDIPGNSPITANVIASTSDLLSNSDVAYLQIPKGWIAVTIPTSEQVGVGGYVQVGDRISMLATINTTTFGQNPGSSVVRTVFRDVVVLRVGPSAGNGNSSNPGGTVTTSLTVLMTACDSEYLFWLLNNATMKYELESYTDYGNLPSSPDSTCPNVSSPGGVGPHDIDTRWHFTTH